MVPFLAFSVVAKVAPQNGNSANSDLVTIQGPFLFTYGTWDKKAVIEGGKVILKGVTPQGGGGGNVARNLKAFEGYCPTLKIKASKDTKMKTIRLLLRSGEETGASYLFDLIADGQEHVLLPQEGATLGKPNGLEKKIPDFSKINQWQLVGDWQGAEPINIEVSQIGIVTPDAKTLALQIAKEKREEAEKTAKRQELLALRERFGKRSTLSPKITHVSRVAPDVVAITIIAGKVEPSQLVKYIAEAGDEKKKGDNESLVLVRGGKEIGWLIGPKRDWLTTREKFVGDPLLEDIASDKAQFSVSGAGVKEIYRKTKPINSAQPDYTLVLEHQIYLKLDASLPRGKDISISCGELNVQNPQVILRSDALSVRSDAVHSQQIGFRPEDMPKRAFLSQWLGTGGAVTYAPNTKFYIVNTQTNKSIFSGVIESVLASDAKEKLSREDNFSKTNIYKMDFSSVKTPGTYRVAVEGVGCSYPFTIGQTSTWENAFKIQMHGLFHERSGVVLGPPDTKFNKPRDFHPADIKITQSSYSIFDGPSEGAGIEKGDTGVPVPEAWGGYHDAGDWNPRRVTHMRVTLAHLELMELFPAYFQKLTWNIPKKGNLPDTLAEANFELDLFRRLQKPDGGVPFGIETNGDPRPGEVSWLQSMNAYVFAPDPWSSWYYALVAARFSKLVAPFDPTMAITYRQSAIKAFSWAEKDYVKRGKKLIKEGSDQWQARDARNFAAIALYALTKEENYHKIFLEDSCLVKNSTSNAKPDLFVWGSHEQLEQAFFYARLPQGLGDANLKRKATIALEEKAQLSLTYEKNNAFNISSYDSGRPQFLGFYSVPHGDDLLRAHYLTRKPEYLSGGIASAQFSAGCNPNNMTYTTGLGTNPVKNPLFIDARLTGQSVPEGLTVYGNVDYIKWVDNNFFTWPIQWHISRVAVPSAYEWPLHEAYFDVYLYPAAAEWTVDMWAPSVFVWGYLAARP